MIYFEVDFRRFERQPQSDQLSIIFTPLMELILEPLDTVDIYINPYHLMIEPIVESNFENTFQYQNAPDQRQKNQQNFHTEIQTEHHYTTVLAQKHCPTTSTYKY